MRVGGNIWGQTVCPLETKWHHLGGKWKLRIQKKSCSSIESNGMLLRLCCSCIKLFASLLLRSDQLTWFMLNSQWNLKILYLDFLSLLTSLGIWSTASLCAACFHYKWLEGIMMYGMVLQFRRSLLPADTKKLCISLSRQKERVQRQCLLKHGGLLIDLR